MGVTNVGNPYIGQSEALLRIRSMAKSLRPSEKKVADYVLAHPDEIVNLPVAELARKANASEAAVVRFSQAVGFRGFWALKIAIAKDLSSSARTRKQQTRSILSSVDVVDRAFEDSVCALEETRTILDVLEVESVADAIWSSERTLFLGVGISGLVAMDAAYKFSRIGLNAYCYPDAHLQAAISGTLTEKDLAVAITHSGDTGIIVESYRIARDAGSTTACITNYAGSHICSLSDHILLTASEQTIFRTSSMSSRIVQMAVIDALYSIVFWKHRAECEEMLEKARMSIAQLES
ncbi:MAG: MurR/RpiR family transcriptional regulator [Bacteroidales bacterium]|jgi:RpiR family carbohydrate utilization transcriptional regulator